MKYLMSAALLALVLMAGCSTAVVPEPSVEALVEQPPPATQQPPPVVVASPPPVETPPAGGSTPSPPSTPAETVVSFQRAGANAASARGLAQSVSVWDSVREGGSFRIRLYFAGRSPAQGGCQLGVSDSHGNSETVEAWANSDGAVAVVSVAHDNEDDAGRTVTVTIDSCEFPDLDAAGITVRIGTPNSVAVEVTTAGALEVDPNVTYTANLDRVEWVEELEYVNGQERMWFRVYATIDPAPNWGGTIYLTWLDDYTGESRTNGISFSKGETNPWDGYFVDLSPTGTVRTATVTLTSIGLTRRSQGTDSNGFTIYYAPPNDYVLGDTLTGTGTMTTFEHVRANPVYSSSVSPNPVTEGEDVTLTVSATEQGHGQQIRKTYDNWRVYIPWDQGKYWENPHYLYVTLSDYRGLSNTITKTVLVCCEGDGWLPEAERPAQRTYSVSLIAKDGTLRTIASANITSQGGGE